MESSIGWKRKRKKWSKLSPWMKHTNMHFYFQEYGHMRQLTLNCFVKVNHRLRRDKHQVIWPSRELEKVTVRINWNKSLLAFGSRPWGGWGHYCCIGESCVFPENSNNLQLSIKKCKTWILWLDKTFNRFHFLFDNYHYWYFLYLPFHS